MITPSLKPKHIVLLYKNIFFLHILFYKPFSIIIATSSSSTVNHVDKVQTWGICLQRSVSWPGGRGFTWDLCVILFFLFNGICIFTALIIWNLLEMITPLRIDQQLTQTGYNQTNASLVNKSLNV